MRMNHEDFEKLVLAAASEIVSSLPDDLKENASEIIFSVKDEPEEEDIIDDSEDDETLGLYDGVPLNERSFDQSSMIPARVILFRKPIIGMCADLKELKNEIRLTLLHEIGHHFGFDEDDLEKLGIG